MTPHTQGEEPRVCDGSMKTCLDCGLRYCSGCFDVCPDVSKHPTPTQEPPMCANKRLGKLCMCPPQEPIEKNILNDPNGTVDKMQKELEQQAKANQPSEGWEEDIFEMLLDLEEAASRNRDGHTNIAPVIRCERSIKDFISTLLTTARREESELWNDAVCSVVDAETLDKIREVIWKQEQLLLTPKET